MKIKKSLKIYQSERIRRRRRNQNEGESEKVCEWKNQLRTGAWCSEGFCDFAMANEREKCRVCDLSLVVGKLLFV